MICIQDVAGSTPVTSTINVGDIVNINYTRTPQTFYELILMRKKTIGLVIKVELNNLFIKWPDKQTTIHNISSVKKIY